MYYKRPILITINSHIMKNILNYIIFLTVLVAFASCDLNITPITGSMYAL